MFGGLCRCDIHVQRNSLTSVVCIHSTTINENVFVICIIASECSVSLLYFVWKNFVVDEPICSCFNRTFPMTAAKM